MLKNAVLERIWLFCVGMCGIFGSLQQLLTSRTLMKTFLVDDFNDFWYITYSRIFHRVCQKRVFKFEFRLLTLTVQVTLKSHIWSVRIKTLFLDKSSIFDYCLYVFDFCFQIHLHFSIQVEINLIISWIFFEFIYQK